MGKLEVVKLVPQGESSPTTDSADSEVAGSSLHHIDELLIARQAGESLKAILEIEKGARQSVGVLIERARRAVNRARLIEEIAVGEFVPDLLHATRVFEMLATGGGDLNFDMRTLFPSTEGQDEIEQYIKRFRISRKSHRDVPKITFPLALGVWGDPRELDYYMCSTYRSLDSLKESEKLKWEGRRKKYFLSSWNQDFDTSFSVNYNPLVSLPVLEDSEDFRFDRQGVLEELDASFAKKLLEFYKEKVRSLKLEGAKFRDPIIRRLLVVLPSSSKRAKYSLEFLPQIAFPENMQQKGRHRYNDPEHAYDPYVMLQGEKNQCANYIKNEFGLDRNGRLKLLSKSGKEAMFSIDSFSNMNLQERVTATGLGTKDGEYMGNRIGMIFFPGMIHKNPRENPALFHQYIGAGHRGGGMMKSFGGGSPSLSATVSESSVGLGTESLWGRGEKNAGYEREFRYLSGGQPVITMVRYLTVVR